MAALTVLTTEIRQIDGLYSLNDLHKAAGGKAKHRPNYFLSNEQTKDLISEIQIAGIPAISAKQKLGTYVCRELVIAYAAWISAAFHLRVIQVFLSQCEQKALPDHSAHLAEVQRFFREQYEELRKKYNYPRQLLAQPYFTSSEGTVRLDINMLSDRKFISQLFGLLNELRADGHEVTAAMAEAEAMQQGIIKADDALDQITTMALKTRVSPAKINEKGRR